MLARLSLGVAAMFLALVTAWGQPLPERFDPARDAATDVAQAVATATAQGKRVLVDVGGEWCAWCHILDRLIASDTQIHRLLQDNYVWVKVNYSPSNKNEQLLRRWPKIKGYPHLFVLDERGDLVRSQDSDQMESGKGYDRAKVLRFLDQYRRS